MTNHELARVAAEDAVNQIIIGVALTRLDSPGRQEAAKKIAARYIADTYAPAMAELERLKKEAEQNKGYRMLGEMLHDCCRDFIDNDIHAESPRDVQIDNLIGIYAKQQRKIKEQEAELERLRRQVAMARSAYDWIYDDGSYVCGTCEHRGDDPDTIVHHPDCPHAKEAT